MNKHILHTPPCTGGYRREGNFEYLCTPLVVLLPRLPKKKNKKKQNTIESLGPPLSFRKVACKLKSFYVFTFSFALFFHCMISHFLTLTTRKIRCQSPTWVGEELKENKNLLNTDGVSFSQGVTMKFKTHFKGFPFSTEGARRERRCPRTFRSSRV